KEPAPAAKKETLHYSEAESKEMAHALDIQPAAPATEPSKAPAAATTPTAPLNDEMITTDHPVTFRVQTNLVDVPVVVRDRAGHAVGNLKQEDFHILDTGKQQEITKFALVKAAGDAVFRVDPPTPGAPATGVSTNPSAGPAATPAFPTRFVAFVFDDVHMRFEDLPQGRAAVLKYVGTSLGPRD